MTDWYGVFVKTFAFLLVMGCIFPFAWAMWSGDWRWLLIPGICLLILSQG